MPKKELCPASVVCVPHRRTFRTPAYRLLENAPEIESQIRITVSPKLGLFSNSRSSLVLAEW